MIEIGFGMQSNCKILHTIMQQQMQLLWVTTSGSKNNKNRKKSRRKHGIGAHITHALLHTMQT
jgi:hypothetical protein